MTVLDPELVIRWLGTMAILVGYANNVITGWRAMPHGPDYPALPQGARRKALYYGLMMFMLRVKWLKARPRNDQRDALIATTLNLAYWSVPASFVGGMAHLYWYTQGAWVDQVGLWKFVVNHVSMSVLVNFVHAQIIFTSNTIFRDLTGCAHEDADYSR